MPLATCYLLLCQGQHDLLAQTRFATLMQIDVPENAGKNQTAGKRMDNFQEIVFQISSESCSRSSTRPCFRVVSRRSFLDHS